MAKRVQVMVEDDLDGKPADETVKFGLDGVSYEIDLTSANARKLREALASYVSAGRRTTARRRGRGRGQAAGSTPADIRDWARSQGYDVSDRGRVSAEIRAAYDAAH